MTKFTSMVRKEVASIILSGNSVYYVYGQIGIEVEFVNLISRNLL